MDHVASTVGPRKHLEPRALALLHYGETLQYQVMVDLIPQLQVTNHNQFWTKAGIDFILTNHSAEPHSLWSKGEKCERGTLPLVFMLSFACSALILGEPSFLHVNVIRRLQKRNSRPVLPHFFHFQSVFSYQKIFFIYIWETKICNKICIHN